MKDGLVEHRIWTRQTYETNNENLVKILLVNVLMKINIIWTLHKVIVIYNVFTGETIKICRCLNYEVLLEFLSPYTGLENSINFLGWISGKKVYLIMKLWAEFQRLLQEYTMV